ncbi:MAG: hypothetical protein ABF301_02740 [Sulfurovum sp.]|jgi:predicted DNA binding CopG/RHH family protein
MKNIKLIFSPSELEKIKILAKINGLDVEEYIKELINTKIEEENKI